MKKLWILGIAAVVIVLLFFLFPQNPQAALGEEVRLHVYTAGNEPTGGVSLSLPFIKDSGRAQAVNAAIDMDGDGLFAEDEWLVRNASPRVYKDYRNSFIFEAAGVEVGRSYQALVLLSSKAVSGFAEFEAAKAKEAEAMAQAHELPINFEVEPGEEGQWFRGPGAGFALAPQAVLAQGNGSLDVFVPDVPNLPQGPNECGPVSVANGIVQLVDKNGDLEEFAENEFEGNIFDAIEELKTDMGHDPAKGVRPGNIVPGKEAFVRRHNLPIVTETISFPTVDRIAEALRSGAAVEVGMSLGKAGHIVSAVGVATAADGSMSLQVHDGATEAGMQSLPLTGPRPVQTGEGQATAQGISYPHWPGQPQFINWIIIQRWVTPDTAQQTGTAPSETADTGPYTEADRPSQVEMLVLAPNEYYPKHQFVVADPDACLSPHYHKQTAAHGLWINPDDPRDFRYVARTDPAPMACGFGTVEAVPVQMRWITWDMSTELLKYLIDEPPPASGSGIEVRVRGLEGLKQQ